MGDFLACGKKFDRHPHVSTPNFKDLRKETVFTVSELKKLFNRFLELCSEDGLVTKTDFMMQPEISFLPLTSVVFDYETIQSPDLLPSLTLERRSPGIDFTTFVKIVNLLSPKLDLHLKYKYLFSLISGKDSDLGKQKERFLDVISHLSSASVPAVCIAAIAEDMWNGCLTAGVSGHEVVGKQELNSLHFLALVTSFDVHTNLTANI